MMKSWRCDDQIDEQFVKYFTPTQFRTFKIYTGRDDDENNDEDRR